MPLMILSAAETPIYRVRVRERYPAKRRTRHSAVCLYEKVGVILTLSSCLRLLSDLEKLYGYTEEMGKN